MISLEEIQAIADRIADRFHPSKIILMGSYAYGQPTQASDADLLVVMNFEGTWFKAACNIRAAIRDLKHFPLDILVKRPDEVAWRYEGFDPLIRAALDKGKVLYEQS